MAASSAVCFESKIDLDVFQEIASVADRINPLRRHLILSKVTGKHIVASPTAMALWGHRLSSLIAPYLSTEITSRGYIGVIGFAETATGLAAQIAESLHAELLVQTTRDSRGLRNPLLFSEAHSHCPDLLISREAISRLAQAHHIVIVDDELTTGNTLLNLTDILRSHGLRQPITAACLVDARPANLRERFTGAELAKGRWPTNVVSLCRVVITDEGHRPTAPSNFALGSKADGLGHRSTNPNVLGVLTAEVPIPDTRYGAGLTRRSGFQELECFGERLRKDHAWEKPLIVGLEEEVFPAFILGRALGGDVQCTTRSPISSQNAGGYPIRSAAACSSVIDADGQAFLYNVPLDPEAHPYSDVLVVEVQRHQNSKLHPSVLQAAALMAPNVWLVQIPTYIDCPG